MNHIGHVTHHSINCMWEEASDWILDQGEWLVGRDGYDAKECLGYSATLVDLDKNFLMNKVRKLSPVYACAELLWYLSGRQEIDMIVKYAPQYERFANDGIAHGAYGHRWLHDPGFAGNGSDATGKYTFEGAARRKLLPWAQRDKALQRLNQLELVGNLLKEQPHSRQAVVTMWNGGDLVQAYGGEKKDLPCTLTMQFLIRNDALHCITTMRSNDLWLGFPYDVWCFTNIQRLIADFLGIPTGTYTHQAGSLHVYRKDYERLKEAQQIQSSIPVINMHHNWDTEVHMFQSIKQAVNLESDLRNDLVAWQNCVTKPMRTHGMLQDLVLLCGIKWQDIPKTIIRSTTLKEAINVNSGRT